MLFKLWKFAAETSLIQLAVGFLLFSWTGTITEAAFWIAWLTGLRMVSRKGVGWHDLKTQVLGISCLTSATISLATGYPQGWPLAAFLAMSTLTLAFMVANIMHAQEMKESEEELFLAMIPGLGIPIGGMLLLYHWLRAPARRHAR